MAKGKVKQRKYSLAMIRLWQKYGRGKESSTIIQTALYTLTPVLQTVFSNHDIRLKIKELDLYHYQTQLDQKNYELKKTNHHSPLSLTQ
jgi:hypothetical protein